MSATHPWMPTNRAREWFADAQQSFPSTPACHTSQTADERIRLLLAEGE
jgi:hypothetical protein